MSESEDITPGDCVRLRDGRIARVRDQHGDIYRVRVRRTRSKSHQFLDLSRQELTKIPCPKGWMSSEGYERYLKVTLEKMRLRKAQR